MLCAVLLVASMTSCSKTELVEPVPATAAQGVAKGSADLDPSTQGGISDDGDDEGDSERNNRRKPKDP